jgi:transposase-like protein
MTEFKNLRELFIKFNNEEICRDYLAEQRWCGKPVCPYCSHSERIYQIEKGKRYKCSECKRKFSVLVGTVFEDSKIPLSIWFGAVYLITAHKKGISSLQLSRDLSVTQKTAWFMLHRIRTMLLSTHPAMLDNIVEIDETFVGGKDKFKHKDKRSGRKKSGDKLKVGENTYGKFVVLGAVERGGKVHAEKISHLSKANIFKVVRTNVLPSAAIMTDTFPKYKGIALNQEHYTVDHGKEEYARGEIHTNTIEGFWSLLKRGIVGIYHFVSYKHLNKYTGEFTYRYNTRLLSDPTRFRESLPLAQGKRIKYRELIDKSNYTG